MSALRDTRCPICGPAHSDARHALLSRTYDDDPPLDGASLLAVRRGVGLSRRALADALGYGVRTLAAWELGEYAVPADVWPDVLAALTAALTAREQRDAAAREGLRALLRRASAGRRA